MATLLQAPARPAVVSDSPSSSMISPGTALPGAVAGAAGARSAAAGTVGVGVGGEGGDGSPGSESGEGPNPGGS